MDMLSSKFEALGNLHDCANDLLRSPVTQQALINHRNEKWVDEVCEGSLRMLEVYGTTRDVLLLVRGQLQDLQSAIRRRSLGDSSMNTRFTVFHLRIKKMTKEMCTCLEALEGMEVNCDPSPVSEVDNSLMAIVTVVREMRISTISVVESILSFLSISKPKLRSKRWFILNYIRGKRVAHASENRSSSDIELAEMKTAAFCVLNRHNPYAKSKVYGQQSAGKHLEVLEVAVEGFEVGLERTYRRLIQTRVSLLNLFNN